jgi:hypothetical protein
LRGVLAPAGHDTLRIVNSLTPSADCRPTEELRLCTAQELGQR